MKVGGVAKFFDWLKNGQKLSRKWEVTFTDGTMKWLTFDRLWKPSFNCGILSFYVCTDTVGTTETRAVFSKVKSFVLVEDNIK